MNQIFHHQQKFLNLNKETIEEEDEFEFLHHTIPQERRVLHMVDAGLGKFENFSWYYYITYSDFKATNFSLKFLNRIRIEHDMCRVKISRTLENIFLAHRKVKLFERWTSLSRRF